VRSTRCGCAGKWDGDRTRRRGRGRGWVVCVAARCELRTRIMRSHFVVFTRLRRSRPCSLRLRATPSIRLRAAGGQSLGRSKAPTQLHMSHASGNASIKPAEKPTKPLTGKAAGPDRVLELDDLKGVYDGVAPPCAPCGGCSTCMLFPKPIKMEVEESYCNPGMLQFTQQCGGPECVCNCAGPPCCRCCSCWQRNTFICCAAYTGVQARFTDENNFELFCCHPDCAFAKWRRRPPPGPGMWTNVRVVGGSAPAAAPPGRTEMVRST
jgi:hypothetical protein